MAEGSLGEKTFSSALKYRLSAENIYTVGKPIVLGFTLENLTDEDFWVLTWYTPIEGIKGRIFRVTCSGREILYEGLMMKRGDPVRNDYLHLGPKGSVSTKVDLSTAYSLPVSNECHVEFGGRIYDVARREDPVPRSQDKHQYIDIQGNAVTFRVVGSKIG
jgi:peptidyl-Lys metalloendopeptidase